MIEYTREQAIAEARRLNAKAERLGGNFAFLLVGGVIAVGLGLLFLLLIAPGATIDDAETFRTWGSWALVIGSLAVICGWAIRSSMLNSARTVHYLSVRFAFDPRNPR